MDPVLKDMVDQLLASILISDGRNKDIQTGRRGRRPEIYRKVRTGQNPKPVVKIRISPHVTYV
jgi:hypothetical protein